jgi:hypothetical protein
MANDVTFPERDRQTVHRFLLPYRKAPVSRLSSTTINSLADDLYEQEIISNNEMQDIRSDRRLRTEQARTLLSITETRPSTCFRQQLQRSINI